MVRGKSPINKKLTLSILLVFSLGIGPRELPGSATANPYSQQHLTFNADNLRDGDIVFRRGRDLMSQAVLSQGNSTHYSHVGLLLKSQDGLWVIHAFPQEGTHPSGVLKERLEDFSVADNAAEIAVYRVNALSEEERQHIRRYALNQLGKPFDGGFRMQGDARFYCTKLVIFAYQAAGITLVDHRAEIQVAMLEDPVIPPDHLRQFALISLSHIALH